MDKNTGQHRRRLLMLSALTAVLGSPAMAQTAESVATLDPLILRAGGTAAPSQAWRLPDTAPGGQVANGTGLGILGNRDALSTPFATTGFTTELAEAQQARGLADVVQNDPSTALVTAPASYRDFFRIRGFGLSSYNVLLDGLPALAPKQRIVPQLFERVELLKGPDTALNGPALGVNVGGSVNVVPKRAGDEPLRRVTLGYATRQQGSAHVDLSQRFGDAGQYGVRANLFYRDGDLAIDDAQERLGAVVLGLDYRSDRFRLSGDFGYQDTRNLRPDESIALAPGAKVPDAPDNSISLVQPWSHARTKDAFALAKAEYDITDNWTAYAKLGAGYTENQNVRSIASDLQSDGSFTVSALSFPTNGQHRVGEAGLRGRFSTGSVGHDVVVSASYWAGNLKHPRPGMPATGGPSTIYDPVIYPAPLPGEITSLDDSRVTARHRNAGLTVADTLAFADDRLLLTLAGRWQRFDTRSFDSVTGVQTASYKESAFTPLVGVVWQATDRLSFYANRAEALQQGPTAPSTAENAGEVFAPTKSKQTEAGLKYAADTWGGALAVFDLRQASGITDPATNIFSVNGRQRHRGVELSFYGEPLAGLRTLGGITLIDAQMTRTAGGTLDGKAPIGVPERQVVLGAEYDLPSLPGLTLSGRVVHTASQFADLANTQALPSWTRLDLGAAYEWQRPGQSPLVLRAAVENVTDNNYWAQASSGQVAGLTRGAPRTLLLSASMAF